MFVAEPESLIGALRSQAGGSLRVVAAYDRDGYEPLYVRDDVTPRMQEVADKIHDDLILQDIGRGHLEDLFEAGALECSIYRFEAVTAFHFVGGEYTGLFVSLDPDADVELASFAETCKQAL